MKRLKCNGRPMLNSLQFFREANLPDILGQREEFLSFAGTHLNLDGKNYHTDMLRRVLREPELLKGDAWRKALREDLCDDPDSLRELDMRWQSVEDYFSQTPFPGEKSRFLAAVTLMTLIARLEDSRWQQDPPEALLIDFLDRSGTWQNSKPVRFADQRVIELPLQQAPYGIPCNPHFPMERGQEIVTYTLKAASAGMYEGVVLDLGREGRRSIPRGQSLLVNVVAGTIVSVLPNKISRNGVTLERDPGGQILCNGMPCTQSRTVTSFSVQEKTGLYLWTDGGRLDGTYLDAYPKCGKYVQRIVEVALSGNYYYLLSSNGMLDSNDPIRGKLNRPLASLGTLREELKV